MAMEIASSFAGKVADVLFDAGTRQLGYLLHYNDNIEALRKKAEELVDMKARVQGKVDVAKRNGEIVENDVQKWMASVEIISEEAENFLDEEVKANKRCLGGLCLSFRTRYRFSKEAQQKANEISELEEKGKFESVSHSAPPPGIISSSVRFSRSFESRKSIMKQIMTALNDDSVSIIGICGMGGVGKTTLVKEIGKKVTEKKLYDAVAMAVVSQSPSVMKIQGEIATMLGMTLPNNFESARAGLLWERIKKEKRVLLILDDIWKRVELDAIGIPFGNDHRGCKILLTSRNKEVCNEMDAQRIFSVETLSEEESWALFRQVAGDVVDNSDIKHIARKVAVKCGGLPIAIVTLGRTMKNKEKKVWIDVLRQLEKSNPTRIKIMQENVFSTLELTYNYLENEEAKSFFLLCCFFPDDYKIPVELLARYAMGLKLFTDVETIEDARCRANTMVSILSSSFLLMVNYEIDVDKLYGAKEAYVKMHDVVRDFALTIASKDEYRFMVKAGVGLCEWPNINTFKDSKSISLMLNNIHEIPEGYEYPKLQALLLQQNSPLVIADRFFQGIRDLKVLDLSDIQLSSLPESFPFLTNLRTLNLDGCMLGDISIIGKLTNLEILSLSESDIEEIPIEFSHLTHLKVFDLRGCQKLRLISHGVISSLWELEELYIGGSLIDGVHRIVDESSRNFVLSELQALSRLATLDIFIPNASAFPDCEIPFQNLTSFSIKIGTACDTKFNCYSNTRAMSLSHDMSIPLHNSLKDLLKRTGSLYLYGITGSENILLDLDNEGFNELKSLLFEGCKETLYLLNTLEWESNQALLNLEQLDIHFVPYLVEICNGPLPVESFSNLKMLNVTWCMKMLHIVPSHLLQRLQNLESFSVKCCESVVHVFDLQGLEVAHKETKLLSLLKDLHLTSLLQMTHIWNGDTRLISLHSLRRIQLEFCMKIRELFPPALWQSLVCLEDIAISYCDNLEVIFGKQEDEHREKEIVYRKDQFITFPSLQNLTNISIKCCHRLINLFTPSIAKNLVQLKTLVVTYCIRMQELVTGIEGLGATTEWIVFPNLYHVELIDLENLTCFCRGLYAIEFTALKTLIIVRCSKMKTFGYGDQIVTPKLHKVQLENGEAHWMGDLNTTVQQLFNEQVSSSKQSKDSEKGSDSRTRSSTRMIS